MVRMPEASRSRGRHQREAGEPPLRTSQLRANRHAQGSREVALRLASWSRHVARNPCCSEHPSPTPRAVRRAVTSTPWHGVAMAAAIERASTVTRGASAPVPRMVPHGARPAGLPQQEASRRCDARPRRAPDALHLAIRRAPFASRAALAGRGRGSPDAATVRRIVRPPPPGPSLRARSPPARSEGRVSCPMMSQSRSRRRRTHSRAMRRLTGAIVRPTSRRGGISPTKSDDCRHSPAPSNQERPTRHSGRKLAQRRARSTQESDR